MCDVVCAKQKGTALLDAWFPKCESDWLPSFKRASSAEINYELVDIYMYTSFNFIDCIEVMQKVTTKSCSVMCPNNENIFLTVRLRDAHIFNICI